MAAVVALGLSAQTARERILRNIQLAGSNHCVYQAPTKPLTAAPNGKEAFYISHYGRHGSRYLINKGEYNDPLRLFEKADSAGILTPLGRDMMKRLRIIALDARGRYGELTSLGALQHRQIAQRMYERFPEIFSGSANVDAKSTIIIRCILSMENALQQLVRNNPKLSVRHDASEHDMYYMNKEDRYLRSLRQTREARRADKNFTDKHRHYERFVCSLFTDTAFVQKEYGCDKIYRSIFKLSQILQNCEVSDKVNLTDMFNADEVYENWLRDNAFWFVNYGFSKFTGGVQPYVQRHLLRKIISEADSCLQLEKPGATLRYGHETMVFPLTCLLGINGFDRMITSYDAIVDEYKMYNFDIFPMGCNLQWIFYRKDINDKDVLFKILLNEEEARLPLPSDTYPYYRWSDFKEHYLKMLDEYDAREKSRRKAENEKKKKQL